MTEAVEKRTEFYYCVRIKDVVRMTGLSRSTIYRLIAKNQFPKQFKISMHSIAWRTSAIEQWIQEWEQRK